MDVVVWKRYELRLEPEETEDARAEHARIADLQFVVVVVKAKTKRGCGYLRRPREELKAFQICILQPNDVLGPIRKIFSSSKSLRRALTAPKPSGRRTLTSTF